MTHKATRAQAATAVAAAVLITLFAQSAHAETPAADDNWTFNPGGNGDSVYIEAGTGAFRQVPGFPDWSAGSGVVGAVFGGGAPPPPPSVPSGCTGQLLSGQWVDDACPLIGPPRPAGPDPTNATFTPPTTLDILYQGLASTQIAPSGLTVQPDQYSYTTIPTLVHAAHPTQTKAVTVLGRTVNIHLHATLFSFDFHDNTPPLNTWNPGAPYPDTTNQHTYTTPTTSQTISLVTTWTATTTNPFTGETLTVPGIIQTRELSHPFEVRTAHTHLTDTAEHHTHH